MKCFRAKPGHKLIYSDINSLEPHVLAHFSQDPGLMSLYGPGAKPNDVYLWVGSKIDKWKDAILEHYDPDNPTPEGIAAAKKHAKQERQEVKAPYLGWMYGLGAGTMHTTTQIPVEECKKILEDIDHAFPGVVSFNERLKKEWTDNGGWCKQDWHINPETGRNEPIFLDGRPGYILNGRNRPLAVAPDKVKDLGNRFVQSTGHDVLLYMLVIINKLRQGTSMVPYNVDMHDATIWQVKEDEAQDAVQIIEQAYNKLNDDLGWTVEIRGEVDIGDNLGDFLE